MPLKLPTTIGHRGAPAYAPENTIESLHTAADMGCKWVSFDIKLTKDMVPVLLHDDTLDRTTNGHGPLADINYAELQDLEAGSWFADGFSGIKIPTLEEAVEIVLERDLGLNLHLVPSAGSEVDTAEATLDILSQIWDDRDRLLISSPSHVSLETAMDMAGDWYRALILENESEDGLPQNWKEMADYLSISAIHLNEQTISRDQIEEVIDAEYAVIVQSVNDQQNAKALRQWGVDAMLTDDPDAVNDSLFKAH